MSDQCLLQGLAAVDRDVFPQVLSGSLTGQWLTMSLSLGAPRLVHLAWCTSLGAPRLVHLAWCTSLGAPRLVHLAWCTSLGAPH